MAFYSNIEDIREKFFELNGGAWELYNGKVKQRPGSDVRFRNLLDSSSVTDTDESYTLLENALNRVSGKGGNAMLFFVNNEDSPFFAMPIALSNKTTTRQQTTAQPQTGYATVRGFDETISDKMQIYDLRKRIDELENQSSGSFIERISERVLDSINPDLIAGALTVLLGRISGLNNQPASQAIEGNQNTDNAKSVDASVDKLIDVLSDQFNSEEEMTNFIDKITETVKVNPSILKSLR